MSETSIPRHMQAIWVIAVPSPVPSGPGWRPMPRMSSNPGDDLTACCSTFHSRGFCGYPAYNEELVIGSVIVKAKQYVDRIIVVDDGSQERTAEVAKLAGADVIRLE